MPRRTLTALPRLRPAVLPRNSTCERGNGRKGQRASSGGVRFRVAASLATAGARSRARSERIGLFFSRVSERDCANRDRPRRVRAGATPRGRPSSRRRTLREGVVAAKAAIVPFRVEGGVVRVREWRASTASERREPKTSEQNRQLSVRGTETQKNVKRRALQRDRVSRCIFSQHQTVFEIPKSFCLIEVR